MGIDLLDITFRIEKEFGIRVSRDAWLEVAGVTPDEMTTGFDMTAGQLYDFILSRLSESPGGFRPPRVSPDALLNKLSLFFHLPAGSIDTETELERLLIRPDRHSEWFELARFLETQLPALRRPFWLSASIALRIIALLAIGLALARQWNSAAACLAALIVTGVVWLLALVLTATEARVIPRQSRTVADLYGLLNSTPVRAGPDSPAPWTPEDVWEMLKQILVDCLAVDPDEVTPDARLVADLGAE